MLQLVQHIEFILTVGQKKGSYFFPVTDPADIMKVISVGNHHITPAGNCNVSGGKLGMQIRLAPLDLQKVAKAEFADVIRP